MLCFDCGPSAPPKQRGPRRPWRTGALFRCSRNFREFTDDISAEETLGLRARRLGRTFQRLVKRPSALALERRRRCDPSHTGVMPYGPAESWLPRLSATPYPPARRLRRLDSLALCCGDVNTFSPEHGICQIKFFRWSQRQMRQNEARPARTARLVLLMGARKAKICEYPIAHELGDETVIARDRALAGVLGTYDFPRVLGSSRAHSAVEPTRSQNMTV
jgi:hypothetical protein